MSAFNPPERNPAPRARPEDCARDDPPGRWPGATRHETAHASALGAPERVAALPAWAWITVAFLGVGGAALAFFLWSYGLEHTTPTRVATTVTLNPVVSMLLGSALLDEPAPARLAVGLAAIAGGIVLVSRDGNAGLVTAVEAFTVWCVRRRDRRILRGLDERTLLDTGLLKCAPAAGRRTGKPFWWLHTED